MHPTYASKRRSNAKRNGRNATIEITLESMGHIHTHTMEVTAALGWMKGEEAEKVPGQGSMVATQMYQRWLHSVCRPHRPPPVRPADVAQF